MPSRYARFSPSRVLFLYELCLLLIFFYLSGDGFALDSGPIDIPLTIRETAGIPRHQWLITAGVPLPPGAIRTPEQLQIMDVEGRFVPAQFHVASRWWNDGSVRWIHCDFAVSIKPNSTATYYLRKVASLPEFPSPIGLIPRGKDFEIITGPLRMILLGDSNQLLDQVWVDEGWGYNFDESNKILDSQNFSLTLTCNGQIYHASEWKNRVIDVETVNALRAVIKIRGSFALAEQKEKKLEYEARITLYGGKTYFKVDLTVLDLDQREFDNYDLLQDLSILLKLNLDSSRQKFTFGGAGGDHRGDFSHSATASLLQHTPTQYKLSGAVEGSGEVGNGGSIDLGWVDLSDDDYGLSVGIRWFSSLFPKGLELRNDSTLAIRLFPSQAPALKISKGFCRTHQLLFYFHGQRDFASGLVRNTLLGFLNPIYASAPASVYLNDSLIQTEVCRHAFIDRQSIFPDVISLFDTVFVRSRESISAQLGAVNFGKIPGFSRFGDTLHSWRNKESTEAGDDGHRFIGDFAHALYSHFCQTNDLKSLLLAEQSIAFTADFFKTHGTNAFKRELSFNDVSGESGDFSASTGVRRFYQTEGLLDSYLLTGCPRSLEAARHTLEEVLREEGVGASEDAAKLGNKLFCLLRGYEVLGDRRYLDRSNQLVRGLISGQSEEATKKGKGPFLFEGARVQADREAVEGNLWQNAILWDSLIQYDRIMGEKTASSFIKAEVEALLRESKWNLTTNRLRRHPQLSFMFTGVFGSVCESLQDRHCTELALDCFRSINEREITPEEPGTFGLFFLEPQRLVTLLELGKLCKGSDKQTSPQTFKERIWSRR